MATKTYVPQLLVIAGMLCRYIQRHQERLRGNLTNEQYVLLTALLAACVALSDGITRPPLGD